ncbi:Uncharacterised protein [Mycoplasmopsis arginini]|nr:Uncharacterised protein [Chlamydia abortus]SGA16909.1 Uncharacterised protein [Mycoplasmopsis arginini]SGA21574.1 Uncharacterised protein [Mycoplasmopsis arginini]SGA32858.1 Uncharacterised protein [Chlamydia abortus]
MFVFFVIPYKLLKFGPNVATLSKVCNPLSFVNNCIFVSLIVAPHLGMYCVAHKQIAIKTTIKAGFKTAFLSVYLNSFLVNLTPEINENERPKPPI